MRDINGKRYFTIYEHMNGTYFQFLRSHASYAVEDIVGHEFLTGRPQMIIPYGAMFISPFRGNEETVALSIVGIA